MTPAQKRTALLIQRRQTPKTEMPPALLAVPLAYTAAEKLANSIAEALEREGKEQGSNLVLGEDERAVILCVLLRHREALTGSFLKGSQDLEPSIVI